VTSVPLQNCPISRCTHVDRKSKPKRRPEAKTYLEHVERGARKTVQ
jgi:hypothetical protein